MFKKRADNIPERVSITGETLSNVRVDVCIIIIATGRFKSRTR